MFQCSIYKPSIFIQISPQSQKNYFNFLPFSKLVALKKPKALPSIQLFIRCDVFQPLDLRSQQETREAIVVGWMLLGSFPVSALTDRSPAGPTSGACLVSMWRLQVWHFEFVERL
jgi:hypothetical protein